jgi:hypothetical protein
VEQPFRARSNRNLVGGCSPSLHSALGRFDTSQTPNQKMKKLILASIATTTLAFVIGCSTSSKQTPTVRFGGYIDAAGNAVSDKSHQATFAFENPSASLVVCAFHQPGGPRDMITGGPREALIALQPNSTNRVVLPVGGTNAETLNVRVMRVGSSRELSVSAP